MIFAKFFKDSITSKLCGNNPYAHINDIPQNIIPDKKMDIFFFFIDTRVQIPSNTHKGIFIQMPVD